MDSIPVHELSAVNGHSLRFKCSATTALHERWPGKGIMIVGDDDHKLENNPGRVKALEAAAAINGVAIFPELSADQREQGMTDFNDLGRAQPEVVSRQLVATVNATREGRTIREAEKFRAADSGDTTVGRTPTCMIPKAQWNS